MEEDNNFTGYILDSLKQTDSASTECTVVVDNVEFIAYKSHLRFCSKFFREVFSKASKIVIKGLKLETYKVVHQALWTGKIALNEANMVDVWFASSYLEIKFLPEKCEQYIQQNLTKSNYMILYDEVFSMASDSVFDKMTTLIIEDFDRFRLTHWFLDLPTKILNKVVENCRTISVEILAQAVDQWLKFDPKSTRKKCQVNLFDDDGLARNISETTTVHTFIFNKAHVRNSVASHTHSEVRTNAKFKLFQLIMNVKFNQIRSDNSKMFTKIADEDVLKKNVFEIPYFLTMMFTQKNVDNFELRHIQARAYADDEPVIVFVKDHQFTLYNLNTYEFYALKNIGERKIKDFHVYDNELYFVQEEYRSEKMCKVMRSKRVVEINNWKVDLSSLGKLKFFMAYPFIYKFEITSSYLIASRFCVESETGEWSVNDTISLSRKIGESSSNAFDFNCTFSTENKIIFKQNNCIFYFDLNLLQLFIQFSEPSPDSKIIFSGIFDYITSRGTLYKNDDSELGLTFNTITVWDKSRIKLYGAEFYNNKLFVFTDSDIKHKTLLVSDIKDNLVFEVKIVKLTNSKEKCWFMTVPADWLTHKI